MEYGDISVTSLHATKLLNTAEGGGCITNDVKLHDKSKIGRLADRVKNIKLFKRGRGGKGV